MFDENEILVRLQNGESVDDIKNDFTEAINNANKEYWIQKEKESADAYTKQMKIEDMHVILDLVNEWLHRYYDRDINNLTAERVIELYEAFKDYEYTVKNYIDFVDKKDYFSCFFDKKNTGLFGNLFNPLNPLQ